MHDVRWRPAQAAARTPRYRPFVALQLPVVSSLHVSTNGKNEERVPAYIAVAT